jgi:hypothetical protein
MNEDFDILTGLLRVKGFSITNIKFDNDTIYGYEKDNYLITINKNNEVTVMKQPIITSETDEVKINIIDIIPTYCESTRYEILEGLERTLDYKKVAEFVNQL